MPVTELRLIKRFVEFRPREEVTEVPRNTRGIYALLKYRPKLQMYDVVYVGMAGGAKAGIRGRLRAHAKGPPQRAFWAPFLVFEGLQDITQNEIKEIYGAFRQI